MEKTQKGYFSCYLYDLFVKVNLLHFQKSI